MKVLDYQKYEEYYVDLDTPNTSFLKISLLLQEMGVNNAFFMLKIYNKKLIGVDPYDPHLSEKQQAAIFLESSQNRWYFYREVFRVGESGSSTDIGGGVPFELNRGNLAYLWATDLNISCYMIMPRQTGKTWAAIADCTWVHQFNRNSMILHFNKNQSDANDNLYRIRQAISMLPMYMQHSADENLNSVEKRKVKNNEKTIRNVLSSTILAMASAGNESKADAMARGKTASKIWYDELAFIFFNGAIYTAATPAYQTAKEKAIKNNIPYGINITTTPGDLATPHGEFAYRFMNNCIRFDESMYDLKGKKLFDILHNTKDKMPFFFIQYHYWQVGKTDEWYEAVYKDLNDPLKARREYLLEWIDSNGNSPFDPDDVALIGDLAKQREMNRDKIVINKYFNLYRYEKYKGHKPVIIGVDVASGLGRDSSAVVVVNPETLRPMAIFNSNMITSKDLMKFIVTVATKHYPNCIITIENNSVGQPLIDNLRDTPVGRKLYKEKKKKEIDRGVRNFTRTVHREVMVYGHTTNAQTRSQMMDTLENIVRNSHSHVGYPELYEEIRLLEVRNNRVDHGPASHDDTVMAYMGALWIVRYGKGLKGKGIYWTIRDSLDEDEIAFDATEIYKNADKILRKANRDYNRSEAEDELLEYLSEEHEIETSDTLFEKERHEYLRALDKQEGAFSVFDESDNDEYSGVDEITDELADIILRNYSDGGPNSRNYSLLSNYRW